MKFLRWFLGLVLFAGLMILNFTVEMPVLLRILNPLIMCCFLCLWRVGFGPTPADRVVAIDILGILIIGFCGLLAVFTKKDFFIDIAIAWALQSFIGTIALAKFLEGKSFDE
ncbi:MAG: monovalent cation/H+ antiporter complex subunit F [Endomicrobiia bacterium]